MSIHFIGTFQISTIIVVVQKLHDTCQSVRASKPNMASLRDQSDL